MKFSIFTAIVVSLGSSLGHSSYSYDNKLETVATPNDICRVTSAGISCAKGEPPSQARKLLDPKADMKRRARLFSIGNSFIVAGWNYSNENQSEFAMAAWETDKDGVVTVRQVQGESFPRFDVELRRYDDFPPNTPGTYQWNHQNYFVTENSVCFLNRELSGGRPHQKDRLFCLKDNIQKNQIELEETPHFDFQLTGELEWCNEIYNSSGKITQLHCPKTVYRRPPLKGKRLFPIEAYDFGLAFKSSADTCATTGCISKCILNQSVSGEELSFLCADPRNPNQSKDERLSLGKLKVSPKFFTRKEDEIVPPSCLATYDTQNQMRKLSCWSEEWGDPIVVYRDQNSACGKTWPCETKMVKMIPLQTPETGHTRWLNKDLQRYCYLNVDAEANAYLLAPKDKDLICISKDQISISNVGNTEQPKFLKIGGVNMICLGRDCFPGSQSEFPVKRALYSYVRRSSGATCYNSDTVQSCWGKTMVKLGFTSNTTEIVNFPLGNFPNSDFCEKFDSLSRDLRKAKQQVYKEKAKFLEAILSTSQRSRFCGGAGFTPLTKGDFFNQKKFDELQFRVRVADLFIGQIYPGYRSQSAFDLKMMVSDFEKEKEYQDKDRKDAKTDRRPIPVAPDIPDVRLRSLGEIPGTPELYLLAIKYLHAALAGSKIFLFGEVREKAVQLEVLFGQLLANPTGAPNLEVAIQQMAPDLKIVAETLSRTPRTQPFGLVVENLTSFCLLR